MNNKKLNYPTKFFFEYTSVSSWVILFAYMFHVARKLYIFELMTSVGTTASSYILYFVFLRRKIPYSVFSIVRRHFPGLFNHKPNGYFVC